MVQSGGMNVVALEFATGRTLYYGLALCFVALALRPDLKSKVGAAVRRLLYSTGVILVIVSSTPMGDAWYACWFALAVMAWLLGAVPQEKAKRFAKLAAGAFIILSLAVGFLEWPFQRTPALPPVAGRTVYVIGDSISVAWEEGTGAWPDILGKGGRPIVNVAESGSTTGWAMQQVKKIPAGPAYVIVEIGGNDLLGHGDAALFERDLEALLSALKGPDRTLVMMELPLPPFRQRFGMVQRAAALRHGVSLIPKRYLVHVLQGRGATVDGLHLSYLGQVRMAQTIGELIYPR